MCSENCWLKCGGTISLYAHPVCDVAWGRVRWLGSDMEGVGVGLIAWLPSAKG